MKKSLHLIINFCFAIIIYCSSCHIANAQMVYMPDTNFRNALISEGFGGCITGDSIDAGCSLVISANSLDITGYGIYDITGISVFINLHYFNCFGNNLSFLPSLPISLYGLDCGGNQLASLPSLPLSLYSLNCFANNLTTLPPLPLTLNDLECGVNNLITLPILPSSLVYLYCYMNQLTSLPALPNSLDYLVCSDNQLVSLPPLPDSLTWITCSNNQLTSLPALPPALTELQCEENLLTSIPELPLTLVNLICNNNNLNSLPDIQLPLDKLWCYNNPNLTCLPKLPPYMSQLKFYSTSISCIPNYSNISVSCVPLLTSLPLCDLFNNYGCESFWNISGQVYTDTNNNCLKELTEPKPANIKLLLYDSIGNLLEQTLTIHEGLFSFDTDTGNFTFTVDTTNLPIYVSCPSLGYDSCYIPSNDTMVMDKDFGVNCKPGLDVGVNAVVRDSGLIRPGNFARIHFYAGDISNKYGLHCASGVTGTVQIIMNGNATYIGPASNALIPAVSGDTLLYSIADFGNVNFYSDFGIIIQTDTTAQAGDQVCFDVSVTPVNGDNMPFNNSLAHCFTVSNSYDPNMKSVYPSEIIDDKSSKLTYTIQFQNTGNAPAQHIYIMDTLDANLDVSSFELLAYSVEPVVQIIGNVARFNFPNINLPDSNSNEPGSHGFVQFQIKLKDSLQLHTFISNTSYIYFDFNLPVQTNTVVDTLLDCNMVVSSFNISKTSFCKGDTLFANVSLNDDAVVNWYVDNAFIVTDSSVSIPSITLGNHILKTEVITYYCTKEFLTSIVFNDLPQVELGNDTSTCNMPLQLDAGSGNISYQWSTGETTQSIIASSTNNYLVSITDANGCANADSISITINPIPVVTFNAFLNSDTLCISSGLQTINSGNPPGGSFSGNGVTGNQFDPTITGTGMQYITYQYTDSNGCSNFATDSVWVDLCLGINLISEDKTMIIYPNPITSNSLHIGYLLQQNKSGLFLIYDVTGKVVFKYTLLSWSNEQELKLPQLANGVYNATLISGGKRMSKRIAVIKE